MLGSFTNPPSWPSAAPRRDLRSSPLAPWQFLTRLCLNRPAHDVLEGDQSNSSGSGRISGFDLPLADLPSEDVDTGEVGGDEGDVFDEAVREPGEPSVAPASTNMRCRGGTKTRKFKAYVPKPRGAPGGPLRTPLHIGDNWQHRESFEVEKVFPAVTLMRYWGLLSLIALSKVSLVSNTHLNGSRSLRWRPARRCRTSKSSGLTSLPPAAPGSRQRTSLETLRSKPSLYFDKSALPTKRQLMLHAPNVVLARPWY